jgi:hypothetical protein
MQDRGLYDLDTLIRALGSEERFRRWLLEELFEGGPDTVVGRTLEGARCPLAHYLTDATGEAVLVGTSGVSYRHSWEYVGTTLMPGWSQVFIDLVDGTTRWQVKREPRAEIGAALALTYLDHALAIARNGRVLTRDAL